MPETGEILKHGNTSCDNSYQDNKAWVEFKTPLDKHSLLKFCQDIERLFRINPYLIIKSWEIISNKQFKLQASNLSQSPAFTITTNLNISLIKNGLQINYDQGIKLNTIFFTKSVSNGSKLIITEHYKQLDQHDQKDKLQEVDKSLTKWAEEIQRYIIDWRRWSWFIPWRYYKQNVWLKMKPAARRITYILLFISAIEIALIILGVIIYFIEYG